jgi:hypothetical protein
MEVRVAVVESTVGRIKEPALLYSKWQRAGNSRQYTVALTGYCERTGAGGAKWRISQPIAVPQVDSFLP